MEYPASASRNNQVRILKKLPSLTKATAIRQYYLGFNCLNDNNQLDKYILNVLSLIREKKE